jgi:hypothetical protein
MPPQSPQGGNLKIIKSQYMIIEYAGNEGRRCGFKYSYCINEYIRKVIARRLKPELKKIDRQIELIELDPNNEGQVKYRMLIEELQSTKEEIISIIDEFEN